MGMTMTQKILAAHAGLDRVEAGQLIEADLDLVLGNDITSPVAIREMEKMKVDGVFDKDKIALVPTEPSALFPPGLAARTWRLEWLPERRGSRCPEPLNSFSRENPQNGSAART